MREVDIEMTVHTIETVKKRLEKVGVIDTFFTKREIKELPYLLRESEEVMYATSGYVETSTMLIVCTNERLLFLDKGLIYGSKMHDIPLDKINSVSISKGLILGKFVVHHGSASLLVENVDKRTLPVMVDIINEQRQLTKNDIQKEKITEEALATVNVVQQLKDLKELVDLGIVSSEEFEVKKAELLKIL